MITVDHQLRAVAAFDLHVGAIGDGCWDLPVPTCPGWDVTVLVSHVTTRTALVARLLDGDHPDLAAEFVVRHCGGPDGPIASWRRVFADARAVLDQTSLDGGVRLAEGTVPADSFLAEACCEVVVHTWDLANAVGTGRRLDEVLVDACTDLLDEFEEAWRERSAIGPLAAVPDGANAQTTLLARFGRTS